ncbi:orotidine-5'-phosphate decarboxylase [Candidatus Nomurabacteria bacterium]|nr:orotidine-5'-phosphate decarboxylase [Candidatus Nomurabacteria bacterium]
MVALDVDELDQARVILDQIDGTGVTIKVGNQLATYAGWEKVARLVKERGLRFFADTKFKDIPNTVGKSARSITRYQPEFFNIMIDNNQAAIQASIEGREQSLADYHITNRPIILGVTVLTSISDRESQEIYGGSLDQKVLQFASLAAKVGLDGVVCSAKEAQMLRSNQDTEGLLLVTPGIRPDWASHNDQVRSLTPTEALSFGVDYLVIGRPITSPPAKIGGIRKALELILEEVV